MGRVHGFLEEYVLSCSSHLKWNENVTEPLFEVNWNRNLTKLHRWVDWLVVIAATPRRSPLAMASGAKSLAINMRSYEIGLLVRKYSL
jgi:hypothetical protein